MSVICINNYGLNKLTGSSQFISKNAPIIEKGIFVNSYLYQVVVEYAFAEKRLQTLSIFPCFVFRSMNRLTQLRRLDIGNNEFMELVSIA